ncbi:hypothetical protein [Pseudomonas sp. RGM 3321]|uniref:hypothetical protein n=1 Tax=Pseudomonas sp. RGM 3321 TaxID=2930089 RepID=UPI001FCA97C2|nr:hypothetical protein [Pseudomonas sp. RGM 3321]MCJ2370197.1 hypothetical protein [Pseudomonas sp. RGM 3321]
MIRKDVEIFISSAVSTSREIELYARLFASPQSDVFIKIYPETFKILQYSLLKNIVLNVCSFFDPAGDRRGNKNLSVAYLQKTYADAISENGSGAARQAILLFDELQIDGYRNKYFAHADVDTLTAEEMLQHQLSTESLLRLCIYLITLGLDIDDESLGITADELFKESRMTPDDNGTGLLSLMSQAASHNT